MGKFAAPAFYSKTVNRFTLRADPSAAPQTDSALGWGCVGEGGEEIHNEGDEKYSIEELRQISRQESLMRQLFMRKKVIAFGAITQRSEALYETPSIGLPEPDLIQRQYPDFRE